MASLCVMLHKWPTSFPKYLYRITFLQATREFYIPTSSCLALFLTFGNVTLFNYSRSDEFVVISHCGLSVHFPEGYRYGASFNVLFGHWNSFFYEVCTFSAHLKLLGCYSNYWIVRVLYIFWVQAFYEIYVIQIGSTTVAYIFIFETVSLEKQKFFILMKSNSLIFYFMILDFCVLRNHYLFFTPLILKTTLLR